MRKMLKSPIACHPTILLDFINRKDGETDCTYEAHGERSLAWPLLISLRVNPKHE